MVNNTIHASENPDFVNSMVSKVVAENAEVAPADLIFPTDTEVTLPGGYVSPITGEVAKVAEVRELNGKDEEVISKAVNLGKIFTTILSRGVVSIGGQKADETVLDSLFLGDRDALLLGIYKATFGLKAELMAWCDGCNNYKSVGVDIDHDIKTKSLDNVKEDSAFVVNGKQEYLVMLPTGIAQREILDSSDKTSAELNTILLYNTIRKINGRPVISKKQIEEMGIVDRRKVIDELDARSFGPIFENITVTCPDCESEVVVPINLGTLFRF